MIHELLSAALKRATEALGGDDAIAASAALQEAALACEQALRQGLRLEHAEVRSLQPIYARCGSAIDATKRRLSDARRAMGQARRADVAYRR
jgi:hypothetical protein